MILHCRWWYWWHIWFVFSSALTVVETVCFLCFVIYLCVRHVVLKHFRKKTTFWKVLWNVFCPSHSAVRSVAALSSRKPPGLNSPYKVAVELPWKHLTALITVDHSRWGRRQSDVILTTNTLQSVFNQYRWKSFAGLFKSNSLKKAHLNWYAVVNK